MRIPVVEGLIKRRILVNFRVEPEVILTQLPAPFKPKLQSGYAIAGICLIRLEHIRPKGFPSIFGINSENAAHRIAVVWDEAGVDKEGVFIPRRDTGSLLNSLAGGRLFPGEHHRAFFRVEESDNHISLDMSSSDASVTVRVRAEVTDNVPSSSVFANLEQASNFFEGGSLGYSRTKDQDRLNGLVLCTKSWKVVPLSVTEVYSSYFSDEKIFPKGTVQFDCALLMENLAHEWQGTDDLYI